MAAAGICLAAEAGWTLAASLGLTAILIASEPVFAAIRLVGAAYLVYLGGHSIWLAVRSERDLDRPAGPGAAGLAPGRALRQGAISNLGNPKMAIFFSSLLPQFVAAGSSTFTAMLLLGLIFVSMTLASLCVYAAVVARAGNVLRRPRIRRAFDAVMGTILVVFGSGSPRSGPEAGRPPPLTRHNRDQWSPGTCRSPLAATTPHASRSTQRAAASRLTRDPADEVTGMTKSARARHEAGMRFTITTGSGHELAVDDAEGDSAPRPAELLLAAQAGCTAIDVASMLAKKGQSFGSYGVSVSGDQRRDRHPHVFERIEIVHEFDGADLDVQAVRRAIELSATRYCTASAMFSAGPAEIHHRYVVRRGDGRPDEAGEAVVTGPDEDVDAIGERSHATQAVLAGATR